MLKIKKSPRQVIGHRDVVAPVGEVEDGDGEEGGAIELPRYAFRLASASIVGTRNVFARHIHLAFEIMQGSFKGLISFERAYFGSKRFSFPD